MYQFNRFAEHHCFNNQTISIIGAGPSLWTIRHINGWCVTLNDAILHVLSIGTVHESVIAHFIDLEALLRVEDCLRNSRCHVLMPWVPNMSLHKGQKTLSVLAKDHPIINDLGPRLLLYNLAGRKSQYPDAIKCAPLYFSSEAVMELLARCGVVNMELFGIDGGAISANGRNYDEQFSRLKAIIEAWNLSVGGMP